MSTALLEQQSETVMHYQQLFQEREQKLNGQANEPLPRLQRIAMERLAETPFPTRRNEDWKYTATTRILAPAYEVGKGVDLADDHVKAANIVCLDAYVLVFVNGVFSAKHSQVYGMPPEMTLWPVKDALKDDRFRPLIEAQLFHEENQVHNAFEHLNMAFAEQGHFIHVPKNVVVDKPVHFLYITESEDQPVFTHPQIIISLERSAELTIIEHFTGTVKGEAPYFTNVANRFHVAENANLKHYRIQDESVKAFT